MVNEAAGTPTGEDSEVIAPAGMSRRTIMAGAAWAVPAVALMSPTPAFAQTSGAPTVTVSGPANGIPASGQVPITATTKDAQGAALSGQSVYMMGPASGTWDQPYGTTDGVGAYTAQYDNQQPLARPGSTAVLSAIASGVTGMKTFTVLGANGYGFGMATGAEIGDGYIGPKDGDNGNYTEYSIPSQFTKIFPSPIKQVVGTGWGGRGGGTNYRYNSALVLLENGTVWSIGGNGFGQLGNGINWGVGHSDTWYQIPNLTTVTQLATGAYHVYALLSNGTVMGWGDNYATQLGPGITGTSAEPTPQLIAGLTGITQLASGVHQGFFLKNDGTVWAIGQNATTLPPTWAPYYALGNNDQSVQQTATPVKVVGLSRITQVMGGVGCGYALDQDGFVWSWGSNEGGKLGDGTTTSKGLAAKISGLSNVTQIAANLNAAYALSGGQVYGWGKNDKGQLANNTFDAGSTTPVLIGGLPASVSSIGAAGDTAFALVDGVFWGWGENGAGQLGDGGGGTQTHPVPLWDAQDGVNPPFNDGLRISTLLRYSPTIYRNYLVTSDASIAVNAGPTVTAGASDNAVSATVTSGGAGVKGTKIRFSSAVQNTSFAAQEGTTNASGSFSTTYSADTWLMPGSVFKVSASSPYSSSEATPTVVGANAVGFGFAASSEMGDGGPSGGANGAGTGSARSNPSQLQRVFSSPIKQIVSCGRGAGQIPQVENSTIVLLQDGTVWSIGGNGFGQLGNGNNTGGGNSDTWYRIPSLSGVKQISTGTFHVYALLSDGTVMAWGDNSFGQLGAASGSQYATPRAISGLTNVTQIASGTQQGFFLKSDGSVWAIGHNTFRAALGQGGAIGPNTVSAVVLKVVGLSDVVSIAGGHQCGYAVKRDGTLWAWGGNDKSRLGIGSPSREWDATPAPDHRSTPVQVQGFGSEKVVQVAGSFAGAVALTASGKVMAWGDNSLGSVGDGTTTDRLVATATNITKATQISASGGSGYAVTDGGVLAWGDNTWGQLGDRTTTNRTRPVLPYTPSVVPMVSLMQYSPNSSRMFVITGQN